MCWHSVATSSVEVILQAAAELCQTDECHMQLNQKPLLHVPVSVQPEAHTFEHERMQTVSLGK